jgi:hypothetical protein
MTTMDASRLAANLKARRKFACCAPSRTRDNLNPTRPIGLPA